MTTTIYKYGAPVLRKQSIYVCQDDDIGKLSSDLFDTLRTYEGIGLAAPQVGISKRAFIIDTTPLNDDQNSPFTGLFLNPEIISSNSELTQYNEGCLSIPNIFEDVLRPETIAVRYYNSEFKLIEEELNGIKARIFQHEFDHLNGILFIDKINSLRRNLIRGKLKQIQND